jgi:hypothetical protein
LKDGLASLGKRTIKSYYDRVAILFRLAQFFLEALLVAFMVTHNAIPSGGVPV